MHAQSSSVVMFHSFPFFHFIVPRDVLDIQETDRLQTPLHKASWYEYYNVCKILVENGASVLTKDYKASHCSVNTTCYALPSQQK